MRWHYRYTLLVLCLFAFFVAMVGRLVVSPIVPFISDEFQVSNGQIGLALTGMWFAYGVTQFPSGILAERYGEKAIILVAIGGTGVLGACIAFAPIFPVFVLGVIVLGAVAGLHYSVATALLARTHDNIGTAIGIHNIGAPLAGILTPVVAAWVAVQFNWRTAVGLVAVVAAPVFAIFLLIVRPTAPQRPDTAVIDRIRMRSILTFLKRPSIAYTMIIAVITTFVLQGLISFLPTFLIEYHNFSPTIAGVMFAMFFATMSFSQVGVGALSDGYGRDVAIIGCVFIAVLAFVIIVFNSSLYVIGAAILVLGVGSSYGAAVQPRFFDSMEESEQSSGFGLVRSFYGVISSSGSVVVGVSADHLGWASSFSLLTILLIFIIIFISVNYTFKLGY